MGSGISGLRYTKAPVVLWALIVLGGLAAIGLATAGYGPDQLSRSGAVAIASAYTWALAARTGGRPVIFGGVALVLGVGVILLDEDLLTTGAAVMTCVVSAVFAVMVTVPAVRSWQAAREAVIAVLVAAVGAIATVGFEPVISLARFEYTTLALSLIGALAMVYRLGAGLHGLGTRGILTVLIGTGLLAHHPRRTPSCCGATAPPGLVDLACFDGVPLVPRHPRRLPAPARGRCSGSPPSPGAVHMRARRRQGWWVCAFGVAATAPDREQPCSITTDHAGPRACSSCGVRHLVVGLLVGIVLIRARPGHHRAPRGRRGRRAEEATSSSGRSRGALSPLF